MALIERLAYTSEVELMHDCPTNTKIPDHVLRIGHTDTCPYCGAELDNIRDHVLDAYDDRNPYHIIDHECRTCGWWRHREFPNHFTNGFWRIGTLYNTPKSAAETWSAKLDELWRDNSKLFKMEPTDFERFVGGALRELYNCEVVHVGKAHDGGVDLILLDSDDGQVPIQVKRRSDPNRVEGVAVIRELRGAMVLVGASEGMFVTTANITVAVSRSVTALQPSVVLDSHGSVTCRHPLPVGRVQPASAARRAE